jgi:hypothetical protein
LGRTERRRKSRRHSQSPAAEGYQAIVELLVTEAAPPLDMAGCSARLLDAASIALDEAGL